MSKRERLIGLDVVRAVAVLSVLVCHFLIFFAPTHAQISWPLGTIGVEIFFVLSGYLIGGILLGAIARDNNRVSGELVGKFWFRRWARTLPNYWLFLLIYAAVENSPPLRWWPAYLTFTQAFAWHGPGFFGVSWSLAIEEFFYLTLPLLILIFARVTPRTRHAFLAATFTLAAIPFVLRMTIAPGQPWADGVRKITIYRLDSIMFGVGVACIERYAPKVFIALCRPMVLGVGVMLAVGSCFYMAWLMHGAGGDFIATRKDMLLFWWMDGACALALPMLSVVRKPTGRIRLAIYYTSLWSYSLYLCHIPVLELTVRHIHHRYTAAVIAWVMSFTVAAMIFTFFESPILRWRDNRSR